MAATTCLQERRVSQEADIILGMLVAARHCVGCVAGITMFEIHISPLLKQVRYLIEMAFPGILKQDYILLVVMQSSVKLHIGLDYQLHDDVDDDVLWKNSIPNVTGQGNIVIMLK